MDKYFLLSVMYKSTVQLFIISIIIIKRTSQLQEVTQQLVVLDIEITKLMKSMTNEKLPKLLMLLQSFDSRLEDLVHNIENYEEDKDPDAAKAIVLEFVGYLAKNCSRRAPRCMGLNWDGEMLMKRYNWTLDNMDDLMTQVGGFQYDWLRLEEKMGIATTLPPIPKTRRTRPTKSIYKHKPTGSILL